MLGNPLCGLSGHRINRRDVWYDGVHFRTDCARCGKPMVRELKGWVRHDPGEHGPIDRAELT